jgi:integrase
MVGPGEVKQLPPIDRKKVRAKMPHCGQKAIFIASRTLVNQVSNRFEESENPTPVASKRTPWNKGKLTGAKPPLRPKHVWSIRTKLQMADRKRDLALFNLAIDSKLRGCDVIGLKVEDIAPNGYAIERATIRQKKTGRSVRFEVTEQTGKRSMITSVQRTGSEEIFYLPRNVRQTGASRPGNMRVLLPTGYTASVLIRACSARIPCDGPRPL